MPLYRPFTWVVLVAQGPFVIWMCVAIKRGLADMSNCSSGMWPELCQIAAEVAAGIYPLFVLLIWALVDVILGVLWRVTAIDEYE